MYMYMLYMMGYVGLVSATDVRRVLEPVEVTIVINHHFLIVYMHTFYDSA